MTQETEKALLRKRLIEQRTFLYNKDSKKNIDQEALKLFTGLISEMKPKSVGLYKNFSSELDTKAFDNFVRTANIQVCYPKIQDNAMIFIESHAPDAFIKGKEGFLEPITNNIIATPDLILTPALAADKHMNRLGYGRGYYDKYIANNNNASYFVCMILKNFLLDLLPTDSWDSKIHKVIAINVPTVNTL
jgi:5-formyltetrahydrofolate cyclo-ligase